MPKKRKQYERLILHGNAARIDPDKVIESQYLTQALSNVEHHLHGEGVGIIAEADVIREREWNQENIT